MEILNRKLIIKSFIYRIYSFIITFIISFSLIKNINISITLGILESLSKILTYYWFELIYKKFKK